MEVFIKGIGNISPQKTYDNSAFLETITEHHSSFLKCIEPDYKELLSKLQLPRRLSRGLKIGITAANLCLNDADIETPDAIITGTGYGMLADTEKFLTTMLDNKERLLAPASFIQSTHNTIGAYIAQILKCNKYNFTHVHGSLSFESALLNSMIKLEDDPSGYILLGGIDEMTEQHYQIKVINHKFKEGPVNHLKLLDYDSPGIIPGEGASFFLLSKYPGKDNYARIKGVRTFYKPENSVKTEEKVLSFLSDNKFSMKMIDLVILGLNGDSNSTILYNVLQQGLFRSTRQAYYKHLSGEYPTSTAFGVWMAANILHRQTIPEIVNINRYPRLYKPIRNILLYNHFENVNHSAILISSCD